MIPVTVLSLGGTILSRFGSADPVPLTELHPGLADVCFIEVARLASNALSFDDILSLADLIAARYADKPQAFVVLQGTDTLEETSFLLDLLVPRHIVVVMAGAMRTADVAGADGPANLTDAVTAARALVRVPVGVTVCMASELHAAALVRKTDANRPGAFTSPGYGPLGYVAEGRWRLPLRPAMLPGPYRPQGRRPVVGMLTLYFDIQPAEIAASLSAPLDGLVVAGLGAGTLPPALDPLLAEAARRMTVLMASRCGQGEVAEHTYVGAGTTHHLLSAGVIPGGFLAPAKARILLTILLWSGLSGAALEQELAAWRDLLV